MHQNNSNNIYSPSMKLWEGNVFADVCLSFHSGGGGGPNVTITHVALNLTVQSPHQTCSPLLVISGGHH